MSEISRQQQQTNPVNSGLGQKEATSSSRFFGKPQTTIRLLKNRLEKLEVRYVKKMNEAAELEQEIIICQDLMRAINSGARV